MACISLLTEGGEIGGVGGCSSSVVCRDRVFHWVLLVDEAHEARALQSLEVQQKHRRRKFLLLVSVHPCHRHHQPWSLTAQLLSALFSAR